MTCRCLITLALLLCTATAGAIDTDKGFDDPELQARYTKLIAEVRCVTCQNQSIKDSNAFIAADLRREIRRLIADGKTDAEIADFLVTRYGDFVLYRPRFSGKTMLLWLIPFLLIVVAGTALVRVVRHRMNLPIDDDLIDDGRMR
tara:strand:- start:3280 stop:3714 length:435 start_codon:yes stop_codon:yes gene_type:complete